MNQVNEFLKAFETQIDNILDTAIKQDIVWTKDYIFENDTKVLVGTNSDLVCQFVLFCAKDVC